MVFRNTFNAKLCIKLGLKPTAKSIQEILNIVEDWNVHKTLKNLFKGNTVRIDPKRKTTRNWVR